MAPQRRLVRRTSGKWIAGVASGLGDYTGVDAVVFRIGFVLLTVAGGVGIMLYAIAWLLLPAGVDKQSVGERALKRAEGRSSTLLGILLLVIGTLWFFEDAGFWEPEIVWALALIAIGVILLRNERAADDGAQPTTGAISTAVDPLVETESIAEVAEQTAPKPARPKSYLGRLTLGAVLLLAGLTAVLDNLGAFDASIEDYFALAVIVVGTGLVVGAWRGRSRGLILLGGLLLPFLFVASLVDVPFEGGVGDRFYRPSSTADVRDDYRLAVGGLTIDLSNVELGSIPVETTASVGAGRLEVRVPPGVEVIVRGHSGAGLVSVFGREDEGLDASLELADGEGGSGEVILDLDVGVGAVFVERTNDFVPPRESR